jgi:hypothetical protein
VEEERIHADDTQSTQAHVRVAAASDAAAVARLLAELAVT